MLRIRRAFGVAALALVTVGAPAAQGALGDLNGDGKADILLRDEEGNWLYLAMDGREPMPAESGEVVIDTDLAWQAKALGDLDGDGRDDVLQRHEDGPWRYYAMDGRVALDLRDLDLTRDPQWKLATLADLGGDGIDDLLLRHDDGRWLYCPNPGADSARVNCSPAPLTARRDWRFAGSGDLDGDGREDVLLRHGRTGRWYYYAMDGGRPTAASGFVGVTSDRFRRLGGLGDFDGDGHDDLLLREPDGGWFHYPMKGRWRQRGAGRSALDKTRVYRAAGVGDLNGDGKDDLVFEVPRITPWRWYYFAVDGRVSLDAGGPIYIPERLAGWDGHPGEDSWYSATALRVAADFPDERLNQLLGRLIPGNLAVRDQLDLSNEGIADIRGIEAARLLRNLDLQGNEIVDITPLATLTDLYRLELGGNPVSDTDALVYLAWLEELGLAGTAVASADPLAELPALRFLNLDDTQVSDIAFLADMPRMEVVRARRLAVAAMPVFGASPKLTRLDLTNGQIVGELLLATGLPQLRELNVSGNRLARASVANLPRLERLYLQENDLEGLTLSDLPLLLHVNAASNSLSTIETQALPDLKSLDASDNRIENLALEGAPLLASVYLGNNGLRGLSLAGMPGLWKLVVSDNALASLDLAGAPELEALFANGNRLSSIDLSRSWPLQELDLAGNQFTAVPALPWRWPAKLDADFAGNRIYDLSTLRGASLRSLSLRNNVIRDISPLAGASIGHLDLSGNRIRDLSPLAAMARLGSADLSDNEIADLSGLRGAAAYSLDLRNNRIRDIAALDEMAQLSGADLSGNAITDVSLSDTRLRYLRADDNAIRKVSITVGCRGDLSFRSNRIRSFSVVERCDDAQPVYPTVVDLGGNRITSLRMVLGTYRPLNLHLDGNELTSETLHALLPVLSGLRLDLLDLADNRIDDFAGLSELGISSLDASGNPVDLASLGPLELDLLGLSNAGLVDIGDLSGLIRHLRSLDLSDNRISDIGVLDGPTELLRVDLSGNSIEDITPLTALADPCARAELDCYYDLPTFSVNLARNAVTDISALAELTALNDLDLSSNGIEDISALGALRHLWTVNLDHNRISDIGPLAASWNQSTSVTLKGNRVRDISPLAQGGSDWRFRRLDLSDNEISDVEALSGYSFQYLNLAGNDITDIGPLAHMNPRFVDYGQPSRRKRRSTESVDATLDLRGNPLGEESIEMHIPDLEKRGVNVIW